MIGAVVGVQPFGGQGFRHRAEGRWPARYPAPLRHRALPIEAGRKAEQEARLLTLFDESRSDLLVLARYMQILSDSACGRLRGRCINIHHSFLPGFKGARPYHQAHERGVKIIGATAHYVTPDLDEGPIIEQGVERVDHTHGPEEMIEIGHDLESVVLNRAVRWHAEHRIFVAGRKDRGAQLVNGGLAPPPASPEDRRILGTHDLHDLAQPRRPSRAWSSKLVFTLAAIGAAVGLGNIWRFPYLTGSSGGSAFVLVYLGAVCFVAVPILVAEMLLGRRGRHHPAAAVAAVAAESGASRRWGFDRRPGRAGRLADHDLLQRDRRLGAGLRVADAAGAFRGAGAS
jgi:folate-dependent phosphoribosylglycinamide formyltransferase PurN